MSEGFQGMTGGFQGLTGGFQGLIEGLLQPEWNPMSSGFHDLNGNFQGLIALWLKMKKNRQNTHLIIHFPTSEGVSEVSERASE